MTLDARHRSSIYTKLVPLLVHIAVSQGMSPSVATGVVPGLGEDDANSLMTEFPSTEADELVTKQFLRAELALTRGDLREEMAELRTDVA